MKKYIYIILLLAFFGCDKVDNPIPPVEGKQCDEIIPTFPPNTYNKRNILVEDFTGHYCNNCPMAAYQIDTIKQSLEKQLVPVGIHVVDQFAAPRPSDAPKYQTDFRTLGGTEIKNEFAPAAGLPALMVSRIDTFTSPSRFNIYFTANKLSPNVRSLVNLPPKVKLQTISNFDASNNKVCSYAEVEIMEPLSDDHSIVFMLLEDSIVDWQLYSGSGGDPIYSGTDLSNYVHKHVLRKCMNGWQGKQIISGGSVSVGDKIIEGSSFVITDGSWRTNHLEVVAFVYNNTTKEVIQAYSEKL